MEPSSFAKECEQVARELRRIPKEVRRTLAREVKEKVAEPLASVVAGKARGPWARVLTPGTKARSGADPKIVIGGMRPRLSGGGGPRDVIFGSQWGGGKRTTAVGSTTKRRGHRRASTNQFSNNITPFVYPAIVAQMPDVLDTYAEIVLEVMEKETE